MLAGLHELAVPGKVKESNSFVRVVRGRKKSENCILGFPSQDSCPGFISDDRYCRSIIRAVSTQLNSSGGRSAASASLEFPIKKAAEALFWSV